MIFNQFFIQSFQKNISKEITFTKGNEFQYITKFSILDDKNEKGKVYLRAKLKRSALPGTERSLECFAFLDTSYEFAKQAKTCTNKISQGYPLELSLPLNGDWSEYIHKSLEDETKASKVLYWFIACSDGKGNLKRSRDIPFPTIILEAQLYGAQKTHLPYEYSDSKLLWQILTFIFILFTFYIIITYKFHSSKLKGRENCFLILLISVSLECVSLLMEYIHIHTYSDDGKGLVFCSILHIVMQVLSQLVIAIMLIMFAWGWTINYYRIDIEMFLPFTLLLLIANVVAASLTCVRYDVQDKYHAYEGVQGLVLGLIRIAMVVYFVCGALDTYAKAKIKAKHFLRIFFLFSLIYILAFPVFLIISNFVPTYERFKIVNLGNICMQIFAMVYLYRLFTQKNEYYQISLESETVLPDVKKE